MKVCRAWASREGSSWTWRADCAKHGELGRSMTPDGAERCIEAHVAVAR